MEIMNCIMMAKKLNKDCLFLGQILFLSFFLFACDRDLPSRQVKTESFVKIYGGSKNQQGKDIKETPDGGYLLLGSSSSFGNGASDIYLVKVSAEGNEEWSRTYGGNKNDIGSAVLVAKDGNYLVLGTSTNEVDSTDIILLKIDPAGNQLWKQVIGEKGFNDAGFNIKEDLDGNGYIIIGMTSRLDIGKYPASSHIPETDLSDILIIRSDLNGQVLLPRTQGFNGPDIGNDVVPIRNSLGADEYVFIGTTTKYTDGTAENGSDILFFKNNKSLGGNVELAIGGSKNETGRAICETLDGGFALLGSTFSFGNGGEDIYFAKLKLNKDNEVTNFQSFTFGGVADERGVSIKELQDGSFIILGTTTSYGNGSSDLFLLKINSFGEEIWSRTFGDEGSEAAGKVINTSDGGFAIVGTLRFGNNEMMYFIKTNEEGLLLPVSTKD
ncbi:hypothetical protein BH23BAC1_BH23BAC1_11810 [soil metagenome]